MPRKKTTTERAVQDLTVGDVVVDQGRVVASVTLMNDSQMVAYEGASEPTTYERGQTVTVQNP